MSTPGHDLADRIDRIEAIDAIRHLIAENARLLDARELEAYANLFAKNGTLEATGSSATGPVGIRSMLEQGLRPNPPAPGPTRYHVIYEPSIEVRGGDASAITNWSHITREVDGSPTVTTLGVYHDTFVNEDGAWRFSRRQVRNLIPDRTKRPSAT